MAKSLPGINPSKHNLRGSAAMIPKPQRDDEGKVQGEFYPLQKAELVALRKAKLINNAAFVHLALRYENPWCDRQITVIPKEFAMRWQMPESSIYEAIAKLKEASAINIKSGRITIEWANSQQVESDDSQQEDDSENPEMILRIQKKFWKFRKNYGIPEKILEVQKNDAQNPLLVRVLSLFRLIQTLFRLSQKPSERIF